MLTPYLFIVGFGLATANLILQRIPIQIPGQYPAPCPTCPTQTCSTQTCPTQTCPTQTCPSQTCPSQTCPTARPPCQNCQNYRSVFNPQPIVVQDNNCPCNKQVMAQNPIANPVPQDALSQMVINRLLSAQPQMQVNPPPAKACNYCEAQKTTPNVINNYIVIPPEFFKKNETTVDKDETINRRRKGKRRKQISRNQKSPACPCEDNDQQNDSKTIVKEKVTPCPCDKEYSFKRTSTEIQNDKVDFDFKNTTTKEKILPESALSSKITNTSQTIVPKYQEVSSKTPHIDNNKLDVKKTKKENRERPKNLEEAIIRDFCKKHPTVPKEVARSLLKKLINQMNNQDKSNYRPYAFSPFDYGHFDPRIFYPRYDEYARGYNDRVENERRSRKQKPLRSGRRNMKLKEDVRKISDVCNEECEKSEMNPTALSIEMETITTEKITATTEKKVKDSLPISNSETQMETPDDLLAQLDQMKAKFAKLNEIESTTVSYNKRIEQYPDLGKEDKVPTVYVNGVEDYYPDFRGDNVQFYASDEECDSKEKNIQYNDKRSDALDSTRYVKNYKPKNIDNDNSHKYEISTEHSYPVSPESYENYEDSKGENEEIRFIIPPQLELPDFETKQINTAEINDKSLADTTPEIELRPAKMFTKDKSGRINIETVYGHSRVVKYGHDAETAASEPVITYYLPEEAMTEDRIQLPDGETIVVVAKSIRDLEGGNSSGKVDGEENPVSAARSRWDSAAAKFVTLLASPRDHV